MATVYLCEKPSQAKDIAGVLKASKRSDGYFEGSGNIVTWCFGHLLEMANPDQYDSRLKKWSFDTLPILPTTWQMMGKRSAAKQLKIIKRLLGATDHVVISTDADREGETIAREILDLYAFKGRVDRLWLSALDAASIRKALDSVLPGSQTEPLYQAGLGRSRADWLVGMNMTRAYTLLLKQSGADSVISVGRVQTPTLNLVVKRDRLIDHFQPVPFFDLVIDCDAEAQHYKAKWMPQLSRGVAVDDANRCLSREVAVEVAGQVSGKPGEVIAYNQTIKEQPAPLPYDLSGLQVDASKQYGIDAKDVLVIAQSLYETHKATTYPRTDCRYLPISQYEERAEVIAAVKDSDSDWWSKQFDKHTIDTSIQSRCWNDREITAHHAIIPTAAAFNMSKLSQAERQIYGLIRRNYLAQFLSHYRFEAIECQTRVNTHTFISRGKVELNPGWRVLFGNQESNDDDSNQALPDGLQQGFAVQVIDHELTAKQTKPPARFTSGTLVAAMKNVGREVDDAALRRQLHDSSGIGTEATRAGIIDTLMDRGYIKKSGKYLVSTALGGELIDAVPDTLKEPEITAMWEKLLNDVAEKQFDLQSFLDKQIQFIRQMVEYLNQQYINIHYDKPVYPCPECEKPMRLVHSGKGRKQSTFWSCTHYPECRATLSDNNGVPGQREAKRSPPAKNSLVVGEKCPQCSRGNLLLRNIKSGKNVGKEFIGCSAFPNCKAFAWKS